MAAPPGAMGPPDPAKIPLPLTDAALTTSIKFAGVGVALNVVAFLVFGGRMWTRTYPVFRMGWDDYAMILAYVLVLIDSSLLLSTIPFAFGRDPKTFVMLDAMTSNKYAVIAQPIWSWAMCAIKTSVALMLLRLETSKPMRRFLWANIALQVLLAVYNTLSQMLQCIPLEAAWDLLGLIKDAKCWGRHNIRNSTIVVSSVNVATDLVFAALPFNFLRKVQRPLRERVIIGMLMALGVFAAGASLIKLLAASKFGETNDPTGESIKIGMWSSIEILVGLITACIPCLRSPFQRALEFFGLVSMHGKTSYGHGYGEMNAMSSNRKSRAHRSRATGTGSTSTASALGIKMNSMRSPDTQSEEGILPAEEGKSREIWCTTEFSLGHEESKAERSRDLEYGVR